VAKHQDELSAPWSAMAGGAASAAADMRMLVHQVHLAAFQVISAGTDDQVSQARTVLTQARRSLYRILAEEDSAGGGAGDRGAGDGGAGDGGAGGSGGDSGSGVADAAPAS
jgi:hypothetical protein